MFHHTRSFTSYHIKTFNLLNFITPMVDKETKALKIDLNDEVVKGTLVTRDGQVVHPSLAAKQE